MQSRIRSLVFCLLTVAIGAPAAAQMTGPSSSQSPYAVPVAPWWHTFSILTVGDKAGPGPVPAGATMAGIPDGLGALAGKFEDGRYVQDHRYMTVFMNHEIPSSQGIVRSYGQRGSFVSQWTIRLSTLQAVAGEDLIQRVFTSAGGPHVEDITHSVVFNRLCSADLPEWTAFYNPHTGRGFNGRLFMNGEENGEGRAFAHVLTGSMKGSSYQLPDIGRAAWENVVAKPDSGDKTIVVGLDDTTPGYVYVYVGQKQHSGNPVERAGLVDGKLLAVKVTDGGANYLGGAVARENSGPIDNGHFTLVDVSAGALGTGAALRALSAASGATAFARPEDGAWDTKDRKGFYFVVTGGNIDGQGQAARLYRLRFNFDHSGNPTGGKIELIVDRATLDVEPPGSPEPLFAQFDNITVAEDGSVMVQEDSGNTPYLARTWRVNPWAKTAREVLKSDPDRFLAPFPLGPEGVPYNADEEHSGIIEVTDIVKSAYWYEHGRRYFLADAQAHYFTAGDPHQDELVEGGQLYLVISPKERMKFHHGKWWFWDHDREHWLWWDHHNGSWCWDEENHDERWGDDN
jgi:hypothetical protein